MTIILIWLFLIFSKQVWEAFFGGSLFFFLPETFPKAFQIRRDIFFVLFFRPSVVRLLWSILLSLLMSNIVKPFDDYYMCMSMKSNKHGRHFSVRETCYFLKCIFFSLCHWFWQYGETKWVNRSVHSGLEWTLISKLHL